MKICIFYPDNNEEHERCLRAIGKALHNVDYINLRDGYRDCNISITFGIPKKATKRGELVQNIFSQHQGRHLIIEKGYIKRDEYYSIGWGGLNGRADFMNKDRLPDRWTRLNIKLQGLSQGESVLVCGQVPWDASVQHINYSKWCAETLAKIKRMTNRDIIFRPHPLQKEAIKTSGVTMSTENTLTEDLRRSFCTVAFNSNSGVESILGGVPTFAFDEGSMVFKLANTDLESIDSPYFPTDEERNPWAYNLAYSQWTTNEMSDGLPQKHLGLI